MRSEPEMMDLIIRIAQKDDRIRAVIMNGSRTNPSIAGDIFQDYDIVYIVTDVASFRNDPDWIKPFGELMIMQLPEEMSDPPADNSGIYVYLMQFADGNRIDLGLYPVSMVPAMDRDSLSLLLLDKDGLIEPFPPASEADYLPKQPTAKTYADSCNEFWWVSAYVAKGLWRGEITYAKAMMDRYVRDMLFKMLGWFIGIQTDFTGNPGMFGKKLETQLDPERWQMLLATYAGADYEETWDALEAMCALFRKTSRTVASHFGFDYPEYDDKVTPHLEHIRRLPKDADEMYS